MPFREFHYRWQFDLRSSPAQLWPLIADTNRFNRDTGVPSVEAVGASSGNARRRLRLTTFGVPIEWEEQPFEWVRPQRFGVVRRYFKGPIEELRVQAELTPLPKKNVSQAAADDGVGTKLTYEVWARPRNMLGLIAIPIQIGIISARSFARAFREYDELAAREALATTPAAEVEFSPGGRSRLIELGERLVGNGCAEELVGLLVDHIENADDLALARIRPYQVAKDWHQLRRDVLELCLQATREGMLDLQWNLVCPMCRGGEAKGSLSEVASNVHCAGCDIDFTVNFERSVELTFRPNPSIRDVNVETFCVGGPQVTPHIVAQQLLAPGSQRSLNILLEDGRYRLRTMKLPGFQHLRATPTAACGIVLRGSRDGWAAEEIDISTACNLQLENATEDEQLFILERTQWSDEAATAAEVTSLQTFRDLFASEALRPGEQISVGTLTVLFTDLKDSTRLYREIGDATAFGRVMNHFDVLKQTIADEDGALVKTIGDAVMAVFRRPASALRAMLEAQEQLAHPPEGMLPLTLKAGLHTGPCIAVTLNDRLDYFGSTVNLAARLEGQSTGGDVVISNIVYADPEVRELLIECPAGLSATRFTISLKGFDDEFELWRVARSAAARSLSVPAAAATGSDIQLEP